MLPFFTGQRIEGRYSIINDATQFGFVDNLQYFKNADKSYIAYMASLAGAGSFVECYRLALEDTQPLYDFINTKPPKKE